MDVFIFISEMRFCTQTHSREDQAGFNNLDIPLRCWQEMKEQRKLSSSLPHIQAHKTRCLIQMESTYAADIMGTRKKCFWESKQSGNILSCLSFRSEVGHILTLTCLNI